MKNEELILLAKEAMKFAHVPYSNFKVGAALLCGNGKVYKGCNIESSSFGATNCAERTAIFKAISEGEKDFLKIAVVSSSGDETFPCGICRQVLHDFMPNGEIIIEDKNGEIKSYGVKELLPHGFEL